MTRVVAPAPPAAQIGLAAIWMIGAIASFTSMAIAGRAASLELDTFELMTFRSAVGLVIVLCVGVVGRKLGQIRTGNLTLHTFRNIAHFTGQNLWFYAITVSPLALVFALEFTSPLWTIALAAVFLGERLTPAKVLAGALGFAGILAIVQPGSAPVSSGMVTAAAAAIMFATTAIFTKRLTARESTFSILFWLTLIQLGLGLVTALFDGEMALPSLTMLPWVILIGCAGLTAHYCLTTALSLAPASIVMPMDFVRLPVIAIIGVLFYAEGLSLGLVLGAALILTGNTINIASGRRAAA